MSHGKYEPLRDHLRDANRRGDDSVQMKFSQLDKLVAGGLPASARNHREWWANGGHQHALAWMDAGFLVSAVTGEGVRFERGTKSPTSRPPNLPRPARVAPRPLRASVESAILPIVGQTDVRIRLEWRDAGSIALDASGGLAFPRLPPQPGLYRMTLTAPGQSTARVYIGETDDLRRRANGYRNAHEGQQTNVRLKGRLGTLLGGGGSAQLSIALAAQVDDGKGVVTPLDLSRKAARVLAESAALVLAQLAGDVEIENLG
jgi:hypothetical protein